MVVVVLYVCGDRFVMGKLIHKQLDILKKDLKTEIVVERNLSSWYKDVPMIDVRLYVHPVEVCVRLSVCMLVCLCLCTMTVTMLLFYLNLVIHRSVLVTMTCPQQWKCYKATWEKWKQFPTKL